MEVDWSSLHVLAKASELVREGLLSVSPVAQARPTKLPEIFWDKTLEVHGQGVKLVLEKRLCATDMKRRTGWLSIPMGQIRAIHHRLQLKKWNNKRRHFSYVSTKEWTAVAHLFKRNGLNVGCLIRLWSFRANGDLCFCLMNVKAGPAAVENMTNREC
ncbi:hypothetical protein BT93_B0517 [Corymbia citriodora subsp. variegata]|nr:hypothetical protein BT93_B0517 [Corymbia citriodora subsp. variegata]